MNVFFSFEFKDASNINASEQMGFGLLQESHTGGVRDFCSLQLGGSSFQSLTTLVWDNEKSNAYTSCHATSCMEQLNKQDYNFNQGYQLKSGFQCTNTSKLTKCVKLWLWIYNRYYMHIKDLLSVIRIYH